MALQEVSSRTRTQYLAALLSTGGMLTAAFSFTWTSPVEPQIVADEDGECEYTFCVSTLEFAWITSFMSLGALLGGFFAGSLMSHLGRKVAMEIYYLVAIAGWFLLSFASEPWMLYVGRTLTGAGFGGVGVVAPIYTGEIADTKIRGRLITFFEINFQGGILVSYLIGYLFPLFKMNLILTGIISCLFLTMFVIPESPYYYVSKNKIEKAERSIKWLRGPKVDTEKAVQEMLEAQKNQKSESCSVIFTERANIKALIIAFGLMAGLQISGINAILFYASGIFSDANIDIDPNLASVFIGLVVLAAASLSSLLVDKLGRKILLISASIVMCVCFVVMGAYFHLLERDPESVESLKLLPIVVLCVFVFMNAIGTAPVAFVMLGEIFAQNIKDVAASLSLSWNYSLTIVVSLLFPLLRESFGSSVAFFTFAAFNGLSFFFVLLVVPETKGKSFSEIQFLLSSKK